MKKNNLEKIKKIDWFLYLIRSLDIFSFVCNAKAYEKIKYVGGIKNTGYLYHNNLTEYYRSEKEFFKNSNILQKNIINNPEKIEKELLKGLKYNKEAKIFIDKFSKSKEVSLGEENLSKLIIFYINLFAYATVFPYLVGLSFEKFKNKNKKIEKIINQLRRVSYYTDFRSIVLERYFLMLSKEINIDILNYTPEEILSFLKNGKIKKENRGFFYYFKIDKNIITGSDKKMFKTIYNFIKSDTNNDKNEIKGNIAYGGVARGFVKIVYNKNDFNKFKKGDILVTINSNPFLMPVIKKCGAIIADEGGMTCHAAIISREIKKPCIIGTKIATKVLKDGDLVEVDADKGIINILKG